MTPDNFDLLQHWLEQQKNYWNSLLDGQNGQPDDWQAVLDRCRTLDAERAELSEGMAQQVKGFSRHAEKLLQALQQPDSDLNADANLEQLVKQLSAHLQTQSGEAFFRQWQIPEPIQQLFQQLGIAPANFSSYPFLHNGLSRNAAQQQRQLTELVRSLTRFQDALSAYISVQNQLNQQTTDRMIEQLRDAPDKPDDLTTLYQIWVDCYEHCYQQTLQCEQYQTTYGELTNATLSLQQQARQYWQDEYRSLGLVPHLDYDQLLQQHHRLRKSHKQSQRRLNQLEQQLEQQQRQISQLQQLVQPQARPIDDAKAGSGNKATVNTTGADKRSAKKGGTKS